MALEPCHSATLAPFAPLSQQLQEDDGTFNITACPRALPRALASYTETYSKAAGTRTHWGMRRDVRMGRSVGELFYTACGTLIFRVTSKGLMSDEPVFVAEDYIMLDAGGRSITTRQCCCVAATGARAEQVLGGLYLGPTPPECG